MGCSWRVIGTDQFHRVLNANPDARQWLTFEIPFPLRSQLIVISSLLLVAGSTLYRVGCPARVQEFSETEWVEAHGHPRLLYISDSLSRSWLVWPTTILTGTGGLLAVGLMVDFLLTAMGHIL